jgi:uncharacterized protein (DUF58 family)
MARVTSHRAIAAVISDFLNPDTAGELTKPAQTALRMLNRKHDVVAVQITDRYELELPRLGRLILEDAETGEIIELNTASADSRQVFAARQEKMRGDIARQFRTAGIDSIQLQTDESYTVALGRFFESREKRRRRG